MVMTMKNKMIIMTIMTEIRHNIDTEMGRRKRTF